MNKSGMIILAFIFICGCVPAAVYMYDMPYEQWVALGSLLRIAGVIAATLFILWVIATILGAFRQPKDQWGWEEVAGSTPVENYLRGAIIEDIDNHTKQISIKGKSFLVWKNESGMSYYREVGKGNHLIGKTYKSKDPKDIAEDIKRKAHEI